MEILPRSSTTEETHLQSAHASLFAYFVPLSASFSPLQAERNRDSLLGCCISLAQSQTRMEEEEVSISFASQMAVAFQDVSE